MLRGRGEQAGSKGSKGSKLGARGASWEQGERAGGFLRSQEGFRDQEMLRERAGGFLRSQEGFRDPGMLRGLGSKLGARGVSWGLPEAPGRFQRPRMLRGRGKQAGGLLRPQRYSGARGASWERAWGFLRPQGCSGGEGERAGSEGSELGAPLTPCPHRGGGDPKT